MHEIRQAGHLGFVAQHETKARLVGQHVLAEARGQAGEPLHDVRVTLLLGRAELRPGAHEVEVEAFEHARLLGRQRKSLALRVECVDSGEQAAVHRDRAAVRRQQRRHVHLDRLQRRRGLARREVVEHALDAVQQAPAAVECSHCVVEGRQLRTCTDRVDFGEVLLERRSERRLEVLGPGRLERRQPMWRIPRLQKGVARGR